MTRVHHPHHEHAPRRGVALDLPRAAVKKKKPFKIVLEAVTQEKKKLHSILTYASNAPTGFGFIPAGHPDFTEWCKEQCRQRNLDVHIVSAKPKNKMHADPEKLSHHVHRVGHHFPLEIIHLACSKYGYIYDELRGLRKATTSDRTNWIEQSVENYSSRQALHGRPTTEKETKAYVHGAVREMFSKIPEADLTAIVNHAFQEGTNRVGNAKELSLARRVQLAVVAHIRHTYTDYDKLLKSGGWMEARTKVEHVSLAKLKEWRDEAGDPSNEIEETFREVIVLDDDEDGISDDSLSTPDEREPSMEIVSSQATAQDLQPDRYARSSRIELHDARRLPRRTTVILPHLPPPPVAASSGFSHAHSAAQQSHQPYRSLPAFESPPQFQGEPRRLSHNRPIDPRTRPMVPQPVLRDAPMMRGSDGRLYQLQPIKETRDNPRLGHESPLRPAPRRAPEEYVPHSSQFVSFNRPSAHSRRPSGHETVLPSVERETVDLTSPQRVAEQQPLHPDHFLSRNHLEVQSPKRKTFLTFPDSREAHFDQSVKRSRPMYIEDDAQPRLEAYHGPPFHPVSYPVSHVPRAQPPQQVIDLNSSPYQPPISGERGHFAPIRSYTVAEPSGNSYVPLPSRRSPLREVRGAYEVSAAVPFRGYIPEHMTYERRAPPASDNVQFMDGRQRSRLEDEGVRYSRSGMNFGGQ